MLLLLFLFLISVSPAKAITTSPTPTIEENTTIQDNIQSIREVVQQRVKEKLKEITNSTISKKGIIGKVIQIDSQTITIEYQESIRKLTIASDIIVVNSSGNKLSLDKVKIGQEILALGINNSEDNSFELKRVVLVDFKKILNKNIVVAGKVVDVSRTSPIFTLIPEKNKNSLFQIKTDTKTTVFAIGSNSNKIKTTDIKSGHKIIAILQPDEKISKTYYAVKILDFDYSSTISPTPTKSPATAKPTIE